MGVSLLSQPRSEDEEVGGLGFYGIGSRRGGRLERGWVGTPSMQFECRRTVEGKTGKGVRTPISYGGLVERSRRKV